MQALRQVRGVQICNQKTTAHPRNCCWNSLTAVARLRTNPFFESTPLALPLCRTIMEEVTAVAKAKGLTIPDGTVDRLLKQCTDVGGLGLPSSMMVDNFEGRPMETEVSLSDSLADSGSKHRALIPGHPRHTRQRGPTPWCLSPHAHHVSSLFIPPAPKAPAEPLIALSRGTAYQFEPS